MDDHAMKTSEVRSKVKSFINDNFVRAKGLTDYKDGDSLLENDIIDSTGVLELVLFLEETFSIRVEDDEIIPENLDSISNILSYLSKKTG